MAQNPFLSSTDADRFEVIPAAEAKSLFPKASTQASVASAPVAAPTTSRPPPSRDDLARRAQELGVDPKLALSFFTQESSGNWNSKDSPRQAIGGMQVIPGTYRAMMGRDDGQRDPWKNMEAGLRYIAYGQKTLKTTDPTLLAAGYHAGYDHPDLKRGKIPGTNDGMISTADYARSVAGRLGTRFVDTGTRTQAQPEEDALSGLARRNRERFEVVEDAPADVPEDAGRFEVVQDLPPGAGMTQQEVDDQPLFGYLKDKGASGFDQMTQALTTARWALGGGDEEALAEQLSKQMMEQAAKPKTTGEKAMDDAFGNVSKAEGVIDTTVAGAKAIGTALANPKALAGEVVGQAANMLPTLGAGAAGAGTGAAVGAGAGALAGGAGAVPGAVAGAIIGGRTGMAAGTTATELGAEITDMISKRLADANLPPSAQNILAVIKEPGFREAARNQGLAKGLTVAAVDQVFLGIGGKIATAPARREASKALAEQGIDVGTRAARREALASPAGRAAVEAAKPSLGARAAAGGAAVVVDSAGEVIGEAASQQVARGEIDKGDALREGVASLGQSVAETGAGVLIERGKRIIDTARAPVQEAPNAPSTASGPLERATENAAAQPERVKATAPDGTEIKGTVTATSQDGKVEIVSDDGEVFTVQTGPNGVKIEPEAPNTPLTNAVEAAVESEPDAATEAAPVVEDAAAPVEAAPEAGIPTSEAPAPVESAKEPAPEPTPQPAPAPAPAPIDLTTMDEPALRERMKYIADQAKTNGGWNVMLTKARREVEKQIAARQKAVAEVQQPAPTVGTTEEGAEGSQPPQAAPAKLPKELSGAKPRYAYGKKLFELSFASDFDRAAYITAQGKTSSRDADYLAFAMQAGQMTEDQVRAHGRAVREALKSQAKDASPGTLKVSEFNRTANVQDVPPAAQPNPQPEAARDQAPAPAASDAAPAAPVTDAGRAPNVEPARVDAKKRAGAIDRVKKGTAYFFDRAKADAWLAQSGIADTHEVVANGKRFEVQAKATDGMQKFDEASGTLGIPRDEMPQVPTEAHGGLVRHLNAKGIDHETKEVPAADLKPTQAEFSPEGVERAKQAKGDRSVIVSSDGHIIDGHHQVLAAQEKGESVKAIVLDAPVNEALEAVKNSPSAQTTKERTNASDQRTEGQSNGPAEAQQADAGPAKAAAVQPDAAPAREEVAADPTPPTGGGQPDPFAGNKLFTADKVEAARARMKAKLGRLNSGFDPEMAMDGMIVAGAYIEAGTRSFASYAKAMVEDFGDGVKPYLLSFYEAVRYYPNLDTDGMSTPASAQAQHEAMMLADAEVAKPTPSATVEPTENANEPQQLDQPSPRELAGAQPDLLQGVEPQRQAGDGPAGGGGADARGDVGAGGRGVQQPGGLGADAREVPVPATRGDEGRGGQPRRKPVQRGERAAKRDTVERGNQPDLIPTDGARAQDRADGFVITDEDAIGEGGAKTKFRQNIAAIRLLKELQDAGRQATRAEQAVLAKYVGWGGIPQAFERDGGAVTKGWEKEAAELKGLLTDEEMAAAAASTRNAHYTSPEIVTALWDAVKRFGFQGGRTLEPSVGVGNFFGLMPTALRSASQLTGVELDRITGGIAKQLYPNANIQAPVGFQDFATPDGYFDLAIGNPPFGAERIYDARNRKISNFSIHNYFFAKSIEAVKPNGVLAMVVTNRLLDKVGDKERQHIAQRAEFLGAIRLPNDAFAKNAGTQVTTDIIFLRKLKDGEQPGGQKWMDVKQYRDAEGRLVPLNEYFIANPDMMLGDFGQFGSMYSPEDPALVARPGQDTPAMLQAAIAKLPAGFMDAPTAAPALETIEPANDIARVKVGSVFVQDGQVYERREDMLGKQQAAPVTFASDKARERVMGMIQVRDALIEVRGLQLTNGVSESMLEGARAELNRAYDAFVKANGPLNADANKRLMRDDPTWPQIAALEDGFDKGISATVAKATGETARPASARKSAIFSKRTQSPYKAPTKANSAKDAMVSSLSERGRVDLDYMASLYPRTPEQIAKELDGLIFKNPAGGWESRDQYLSGNVKKKLAQAIDAAKTDPAMRANIEALRAVQPADIEAVDIDVKTGAHWVPTDVMDLFIKTVAEAERAKTLYNPGTATWTIAIERPSASASTQYSTDRVTLSKILEAAANQKQITVYDESRDGTRTANEAATTAANEKVERVKAEWKNWIWADDARRERLARIYNDTFNTDVQREFDGAHLTFPGKVGDDIIQLRPHQANAVWRMVQSGTTLLDHVVGAGKTFTMIAGIMEMRRMGLAKKPMLAVPNHLVGQWAEDFMKLYPGANILAATKKDFEKDNRKKLFARIATGDWDAVIVAHSSFGKVEVEPEFQAAFIKQQIADMDTSISAMRAAEGKSSRNVKQIEKQKANLEEKLKRLFDTGSKDDNLFFGELGIDAVLLDEAHEFKNLGFSTGMQRVAGLGNPTGSNKAAGMFMKIQATLARTGGRNVVFATGTPISNTMAEMYTMQRFLDYGTLKDQGIAHFDAWAKTFGEVVTDWELSPSGQYKMNSRFAKFVNMPELMQRYQSFADVVNRDDINRMLAGQGKKLPVPKVATGKPENTVVERSRDQANYIGVPTVDENGVETYPEGSLIYRSEHLPKKAEKGADNMLKIMSDARKAALDMRLIDPSYPDNPASKVNVAAGNIKSIYDQWTPQKGAQLVFIDLSTPKNAVAKEAAALRDLMALAEQGDEAAQEKLDAMSPDELLALDAKFSVYDDLKAKLIASGIPENEIAFIHDANTELQKEDLFGKVRSGRVRVLLGSTAKMGAGMNVQERLVALHHLDAPWRPSDLEQREGRIIRQGNKLYDANPDGFEVRILRYATKQTLDSRMWQTIEAKARFIEQVRKGTGEREVEDVASEAANSAEMKAASSGNPLILEEMSLRQAIRKLENQQSEHNREQFRIKDRMRWAETYAEQRDKEAVTLAADAPLAPAEFKVKIGNQTFDKHGEAGEAILDAVKAMQEAGAESREIGSYGGFKLIVDDASTSLIDKKAVLTLEGKGTYQVEANPGSNPAGLALRMQNTVKALKADAAEATATAERNRAEIPKLQAQIKPWGATEELAQAKARQGQVIEQLRPKKKPDAAAKPADGTENSLSIDDGAAPADTSAYGPAPQSDRDAVAAVRASLDAGLQPGQRAFVWDAVAPQSGPAGNNARSVAGLSKRLFGRDLVFVKFDGPALFNGAVSKKAPGKIFINIQAKRPLMAVLGHELLHEMAKSAPGVYAQLSRRLDAVLKGESVYADRVRARYAAKGIQLANLDTREELEADIVGDNFMDPAFWTEVAKDQPGLFRRVADQITKWLDAVVRKLGVQRPFGTDEFLADIAEARAAVADAVRQFSGTEVGAVADGTETSLSVADEPAGLTPPEQGLLRRVQSAIQDNLNRVKQVQEGIERRLGRKLPEYADYYQAETNRPGRIAARLEDAKNTMTGPLMEKLAKSGHTAKQLGELLHAMHAAERNERIAAINPAMPDGGSGMTNAEAAVILAKYRGNEVLNRLADDARAITKATLEMKLAYGLIDIDTFTTLTEVYQNYVPLKGDGEYGPKIKRAMGHEGRDEFIMENIARDYDQAVVVGERNQARQALLQMVLTNPDPNLWTVGLPPRGRFVAGKTYSVLRDGEEVAVFDSESQVMAFMEGKGPQAVNYEVQDSSGERVQSFVKPLQDNEVMVYVDGRAVRIQIKDETLARQVRPLDQGQMNVVLETMRSVNRYLSRIYTAYSPTFIITNPLRDIQTGTINIMGTQGSVMAAKAWSHYPSATKALAVFAATKKMPGGEMGKWLSEYRAMGGKTGASWMSDLEQQGKTLQRMFDDAYGASGYLADGKIGKASWIATRKAIGGLAHVIEIANQASENALRLGLYVALRKDGASASTAAQAAKNVTVNFDRKGTQTGVMSAMYLFINPAIQGTANAVRTLAKGEHKAQAWAALGALAMLGAWAAGQGVDDDEDRWLGEDWGIRSNKLVMNIGGHRIVVPLSLEFAPFFALGVALEEARRGAVSKTEAAAHIVSSFISAYIPLRGLYSPGSDNQPLDTAMAATPTVLRPFLEAATNRNSFGSKIVPEGDFSKDRPDNLKMNRATKGTVFDSAAQGVAKVGEELGAGRYENDITKVSPEMLKHFWRTYTGGLGTFVTDMASMGKMASEDGVKLELSDIPIAKSFVTEENVKPIRGRYFELTREARAVATEFREAKKAGDGKAMDDILNRPEKAEMLSLTRLISKTNELTASIRDQMADINADTKMPLAEKRARLKELEATEEDVLRGALDAFRR